MVRSNEADRNSNDSTYEVYGNSNENAYATYGNSNESAYATYGDPNAYETYIKPNGKNYTIKQKLNSNQAPVEKPTMMKVMRNAIKRHWKAIGGFQISCESSFFILLICKTTCITISKRKRSNSSVLAEKFIRISDLCSKFFSLIPVGLEKLNCRL